MERVWDYPRPPAVVACERRIRVELGGELLADSTRALRVLETSHPPTIYVPPADVRAAGWTYADPAPGYEALRDHVAFYPGRVDAAWVGEERIEAQEGDFYGGWITADLVGPFKGPLGTLGW